MRLIVNFEFFSCHFSVTTLGLDLFSGAYFNSFTVCMVPSDKIARLCQLTPLMLRSAHDDFVMQAIVWPCMVQF